MLPVRDHMPLRDAIKVVRAGNAHDRDKIPHGTPIARPRVGGGEVRQPDALDRHSRQHVKRTGKINTVPVG